MKLDMNLFCQPKSIAIIGASATPGKWGNAILQGILKGGYQGKIYPINPKTGDILGFKAYPNVTEVPEPIELAIIGIRADLVAQAVADCRKKGVKAAVIISGGFAESGEAGKKFQEDALTSAGDDVRIVGPNVVGIVNLNYNFDASFFRPLKGPFALICQGGNIIGELEYLAHRKGLGFTYIIDPGNQADVGICDFLEYIQSDPNTKAILMYIEGFKKNDGKRFLSLAQEITKTRPIIVIKVGTSEAGRKAVGSHTGSLAGDDAIFEAAFKQVGIIRVRNPFELVDVAEVLVKSPLMKGNRFGILVDGGSHSTISCDAAARYGLELATLTDETQQKLRAVLMPHSAVANPVDFAGAVDADIKVLTTASSYLLEDGNVDGLLVAGMNFGGYGRWFDRAEEVPTGFTSLPGRFNKPMLLHNCFLSEKNAVLEEIAASGVPVFNDPERTVRCLAALRDYGKYLDNVKSRPEMPVSASEKQAPAKVRQLFQSVKAGGQSFLLEPEAREVLKTYGLPVLDFALAKTKEQAVKAAEMIGYPVVAKIVSPHILHKTGAGGVKLNLKTKTEVARAFEDIMASVKKFNKDADIAGVIISPMAEPATEIIIGLIRDAQFGPVLMFGLGGIFVEVLKDVAFRVLPIDDYEARKMVAEIRGYPVLQGVRGEARDIDAIVDMMLKISKLAMENEEIRELDLNPVFVYGRGARIIDARILL